MSKELFLRCKDHSVSGEEFELLYDIELDMLITSPIPDISELGKYYESGDYISHTDSNASFLDKLYQGVKRFSIQKKVKLLNSFLSKTSKKLTVLDIGSGTGDFLLGCKNSGFEVFGVEPNVRAKSLSESKLDSMIYTDISELEEEKFDFITMWHVLEHIPNLSEYVVHLKSLLKEDGVLIVAVPNYKSYDAVYYEKFWAAFDVPRHLSHFSMNAISRLFSNINMKVDHQLPMIFDSFYVALLSEKYKTGKSNWRKALFIGLLSNLKAWRSGEYSSLIYIIKNN